MIMIFQRKVLRGKESKLDFEARVGILKEREGGVDKFGDIGDDYDILVISKLVIMMIMVKLLSTVVMMFTKMIAKMMMKITGETLEVRSDKRRRKGKRRKRKKRRREKRVGKEKKREREKEIN